MTVPTTPLPALHTIKCTVCGRTAASVRLEKTQCDDTEFRFAAMASKLAPARTGPRWGRRRPHGS